MSATTETLRTQLGKIRTQAHARCVVCGPASDPRGLALEFAPREDGGVQALFDCDRTFEGYPGKVHGGVISALLDGAMTNCLFAHGRTGLTAELLVRYRLPLLSGRTATVCGWLDRSSPRLCFTRAEVIQDGQIKATATAKFMMDARLTKTPE